jgi:hypothetical protein
MTFFRRKNLQKISLQKIQDIQMQINPFTLELQRNQWRCTSDAIQIQISAISIKIARKQKGEFL